MKKFLKKNIFSILILLVYAVLLIIGLLNHEFWRDELQAWTIARDLSIVDIFKQMRWEGHSCLWHLIIAIPAKLDFSPTGMGFVSIIFMLATAILILYKSPFDLAVKLILLFSSPFLYFYSIESRVYSIIPFLISLLAIFYPKRLDRPLIFGLILALLVNTHIIMSCFVGIVTLFYIKDIIVSKKYKDLRYFCSLGFILIGIIILGLQVWQSLSVNSIVADLETSKMLYSTNPLVDFFYQLLHGLSDELESYTGLENISNVYLYIIFGIFIIGMIIGLIKSFKTTMFCIIPFLFIFLIHVFIWFSLPQRAVMIIILLMFAVWVHFYDIKSNKSFIIWQFVLSLFCALSIPYGVYSYLYDINNPVSGAEATAEYIETNLDDAIFICPIDYVATSITGYIDEDIFYSNIRKDYFTFVNWDEYWRKEVSFNEFYESIYDFIFESDQDVYMIYSKDFMWNYDEYIETLENLMFIEKIYESPKGQESESYIIYKFLIN